MIEITITGEQKIEATIKTVVENSLKATMDAVMEQTLNIQRVAKGNLTESHVVDTGRLRSDIQANMKWEGEKAIGRVGTDVKYAAAIEFGSRPHWPPIDPIRQWCRRHKIDEKLAFVIARKISKVGTPAKPFLYPAFEQERPNFERLLRASFARIAP
jgi:hypothetical protein